MNPVLSNTRYHSKPRLDALSSNRNNHTTGMAWLGIYQCCIYGLPLPIVNSFNKPRLLFSHADCASLHFPFAQLNYTHSLFHTPVPPLLWSMGGNGPSVGKPAVFTCSTSSVPGSALSWQFQDGSLAQYNHSVNATQCKHVSRTTIA